MTASNPCCLKCNGYRSEKYPKRPECNDQYCPCHKETPAAVEVEMVGVGCEYCANLPEETQKKLHPTQRASIEERVKDSIARYEKSKAEGTLDRDYPVIGRIEPTPQPEKDIEENLRLMNHGIIYQQPAKEWWEESFDKFNDFFDKYDSDNWFARGQIKLLIREVAAQSEKKGRNDAVDYICGNSGEMVEATFWVSNQTLERARSSEEGKTNNK